MQTEEGSKVITKNWLYTLTVAELYSSCSSFFIWL